MYLLSIFLFRDFPQNLFIIFLRYLSFARFCSGALGEPLAEKDVPLIVKQAHPCLYGYEPPAPPPIIATAGVEAAPPKAEVKTSIISLGAAADPALAPTEEVDKDKKKRRITPTLVSQLSVPLSAVDADSVAVTAVEVRASGCLSPILAGIGKGIAETNVSDISTTISETAHTSSHQQPSLQQKKRITPTLLASSLFSVAPATPATSSSGPVSVAVSSALSSSLQANPATAESQASSPTARPGAP